MFVHIIDSSISGRRDLLEHTDEKSGDQSLWKEMPLRTKDYILRPKLNGYQSLHMAVDVSENGQARPLMEIQIRTTEMDMLAAGGTASHSFYKSGLTDPEEVVF